MTLQSSGAISLYDVQVEFGGSNPIGIDEYYGRAAGIPASGTISLADFYGKSAAPPSYWTSYIMGFFEFSVRFGSGYSDYSGIIITPGASNSPVTFTITGRCLTGTGDIRLYVGGTLSGTWYPGGANPSTSTTSQSFGSSTLQFRSIIYDNDSSNGSTDYDLNYFNVNVGATRVYRHAFDNISD
jgi:hypothetical protein